MNRFLVGCSVLVLALAMACDSNDGPTAPTPTPPPVSNPPPAPTPPPPTPPPTTPPTSPTSVQGVTGTINKNVSQGGTARAAGTNNASVGRHVLLACYDNSTGELGEQELFAWEGYEVQPGESFDFAVDVPACAWQCDLVVGRGEPREPPFYTSTELLAFREGGSGKCAPPPPPPPTGCEIDLRCVEERPQENIINGELRGLEKHLVCNAPGIWQHDADEAETNDTRFWGYWSPVATPETGNVKFTAAADPRCMQTFAWPIPVDPCADSELSVRYSFQNRDLDVKATAIITAADPAVTIHWGDGTSTGPVGPGEYMHTYPKTEQEQSFTITVVSECERDVTGVIVPPLPPPPCVPPNEQSFQLDGPIGNPAAECSFFGNYVPGTPADFFVTKCGLFYEVTHDAWDSDTCSNGKDVSHSTACVCAPIVD